MPWRQISGNLVYGIGTNKDTGSWFKNILHNRNLRLYRRELYTRARKVPCKSCGKEHKNWDQHFWKCKKYRPIWRKLSKLINDTTHGGAPENGCT